MVDRIPGLDTVEHEVVEVEHDVDVADRACSQAPRSSATRSGRSSSSAPRWSRPAWPRAATTWTPPASRTGCSTRRAASGQAFADAGPAALARRRADVHHRRDRGEHRAGDRPASTRSTSWCCGRASRPTPPRRRSSRSSRPTGSTSQQNEYVAVGPPGHPRVRRARPARARRSTVPWGGTAHPVWFKNDPRVATVHGHRRGARPRGDGRASSPPPAMFEEQITPLDAGGAGGRAGRHRRRPAGRHAAAGEPADQHLHRLGARVRAARPRARAPSTATPTTSRPACCRPTPRTRCCSSRRGGPGSPRPARRSGTASCWGCCATSGWCSTRSSTRHD